MVKYLLMLKRCFLRFDFILQIRCIYTIHLYVSHRTQSISIDRDQLATVVYVTRQRAVVIVLPPYPPP